MKTGSIFCASLRYNVINSAQLREEGRGTDSAKNLIIFTGGQLSSFYGGKSWFFPSG